jgi:hypothetical protein
MTDENSTQASPFTLWWWIAGGFFLIVIVAAVAMLATRGGQVDPTASPTASADASPSSSATSSGSLVEPDGACSLPAADQDIPVDPPQATWEAQGYILVPSSEVYGPIPGQDPQWPCFAHSPAGALFAAMNLHVRMVAMPDYEEFARAAAVDSPALESWLAEQDPATHGQTAGQTIQYAGFRFQKVESDAVVVDVAAKQADLNAYVRISLLWDSEVDNWRVDLATTSFDPAVVESLASFTTWSAA